MSVCGLQGHAYTDPTAPSPPGICDRCGFKYLLSDLTWQTQWAGSQLLNLRILVCCRCLDTPAEFLRTLILPADPPPILNVRPGFYQQEESQGQFVDNEIPPVIPPSYYRTWVTDNGDPMRDSLGNIFYFVSDVAA